MTRSCGKCNRMNPPGAVFCYFDGMNLDGAANKHVTVAVNFATLPFPTPFVFPTGAACRNFSELAVTCRREHRTAVEILRRGHLETFFNTMGRLDLALVAKTAARVPDSDRALDDLLAKLPGSPLSPAKFQIESREFDLGTLAVGTNRALKLELSNKGERLLTGKVAVEGCLWLVLDERNASEKIIQFFDSLTLPVRVRGDQLRSYHKPQQARIVIETNGGSVEVVVRALVPVKPFPDGTVLAGATSPRELCKLARAKPKEAAPLFEGRAIRQWYEANGWPYPIRGPIASGVAAVEQFFEVLGLVQPPKVELNQSAITLQGKPGDRLEAVVIASTPERRVVVAHAVSSRPWLTVGNITHQGQAASIPVIVEKAPEAPEGALTANLTVSANGNQQFNLPVTLIVNKDTGRKGSDPVPPSPARSGKVNKVDPAAPPQARGGKIDFRRIYFNAVLGGMGGLVGWLLLAVANQNFLADFTTYPRMIVFGLLLGVCIGAAIGSTEGLIASRSLRRLLKGSIIGAMLGALGGAAGLALGELIFEEAGGGVWPRAVGWAIFGLFVGTSDGFALWMPSKIRYGLLGGLLGGLIGGSTYERIQTLRIGSTRAENIAWGGAIGLILLGACIGALIGLVESLLRKSFLFFFTGRLEGQTRTLDSRRTHTLGSASRCSIVLPGDPTVQPVHAEISYQNGNFGIAPRNGSVIVRREGVEHPVTSFYPLAVGDRIQLGETTMIYRGEEARKKP